MFNEFPSSHYQGYNFYIYMAPKYLTISWETAVASVIIWNVIYSTIIRLHWSALGNKLIITRIRYYCLMFGQANQEANYQINSLLMNNYYPSFSVSPLTAQHGNVIIRAWIRLMYHRWNTALDNLMFALNYNYLRCPSIRMRNWPFIRKMAGR